MQRFAVIIPARFASQRFPGKPLVELRGATGVAKTLIRRSWECARQIPGASGVWVATDDARIADEVRGFGGKVVMTSPDCRNGTERCAEAMDTIGGDFEFVVNLQGDAPLTPVDFVPPLVARLEADPSIAMATPVIRCSPTVLAGLRADERAGRVGGTTAVFDAGRRALYFSKRVIPHIPANADESSPPVHLHLGTYAYRREALTAYRNSPPSILEEVEGLEQLRFLDRGIPIGTVLCEPAGWDPIELNNPQDVAPIEAILAARKIV